VPAVRGYGYCVSTNLSTGEDVVSFLKAQHEEIKLLLDEVANTIGEDRQHAFVRLRRLLAVHETAEEEIVHPRVRHVLTDGDAIVIARLNEEFHGKQALAELEKLDPDSRQFTAAFAQFSQDVLAHAEAEEREEFSRLADKLDDDHLERMRTAVAIAERLAPTRPHPSLELAGENFLAGPFAAMLDRVRDLISGKH
jgi:hemerythrin superfamily protein